jgi:hypothetical protein
VARQEWGKLQAEALDSMRLAKLALLLLGSLM